MQGITIPLGGEDYFGYMYRMFYYPTKDSAETDKQEVNITKYMVDEITALILTIIILIIQRALQYRFRKLMILLEIILL